MYLHNKEKGQQDRKNRFFFRFKNSQILDAINTIKQYSSGDVDARIENINDKGRLPELFNMINDMLDQNLSLENNLKVVSNNLYFDKILSEEKINCEAASAIINQHIINAEEVMQRIKKGDLEARILNIEVAGAFGELFYTINDVIDRTDAYVKESQATMEHVNQNMYFRRIVESGMLGSFKYTSCITNQVLNNVQKKSINFKTVTDSFDEVVGDIVKNVSLTSTGVMDAAKALIQIAAHTSEKADIVFNVSSQTTANVQTIAAATEQMSFSINEISEQVSGSKDLSESATTVSNDGGTVLAKFAGVDNIALTPLHAPRN